jgi:hypothetical protein
VKFEGVQVRKIVQDKNLACGVDEDKSLLGCTACGLVKLNGVSEKLNGTIFRS